MDAEDVIAVLHLLDGTGIDVWVDGGWGVDALIGQETRSHGDLDVVVPLPELDRIRRVLAGAGYTRMLRDLKPTALALAGAAGRSIDLHLVVPTGDGGGDQLLEDGGRFHYPAPVAGSIAGHAVRCVDADTQVRAHLGYPPTTQDHQDMRALATRLGVRLPPPYAADTPP